MKEDMIYRNVRTKEVRKRKKADKVEIYIKSNLRKFIEDAFQFKERKRI